MKYMTHLMHTCSMRMYGRMRKKICLFVRRCADVEREMQSRTFRSSSTTTNILRLVQIYTCMMHAERERETERQRDLEPDKRPTSMHRRRMHAAEKNRIDQSCRFGRWGDCAPTDTYLYYVQICMYDVLCSIEPRATCTSVDRSMVGAHGARARWNTMYSYIVRVICT